jgi:hypothetical protein
MLTARASVALFSLVAGGAVVLAGCRPSTAPAAPGLSSHLDVAIRHWYAKKFGCAETAFTGRRVGEIPSATGVPWSIYEYTGCNQTRRVFTACENADTCTEWTESIEARAAFDLGCDAKELRMMILDAQTLGVQGCGNRASYMSLPGGEWVLNNRGVKPGGGPATDK